MDINKVLKELPMGFSMSLARDLTALNRFANLPTDKQDEIVLKAKAVTSKKDMIALVNSISVT